MLFFSGLNHPIPEKIKAALEVFNKRSILVVALTLKVNVPKRKTFPLCNYLGAQSKTEGRRLVNATPACRQYQIHPKSSK